MNQEANKFNQELTKVMNELTDSDWDNSDQSIFKEALIEAIKRFMVESMQGELKQVANEALQEVDIEDEVQYLVKEYLSRNLCIDVSA